MNTQLPITGLRHHDYSGRLDELYEHAPGQRMSISIEHENVAEPDAVTAYMGHELVGYVRSGAYREQACALIRASGRDTLLGRVTGIDLAKGWLWVEFRTEQPAPCPPHQGRPAALGDWSFEGELLPEDEAESR